MAEAAVRHIDDAGSLLDRSAVPRWLMRSILAGASIYFLSAFFATLVLYIDRPHVFLTFAAPQLPLVAVMVLGAIAVLKPRRGVARVALLFLLTLPVGWIAIAVIGLNERLPAGAYWTLPASFRLVLLAWLGVEFWIGILALLRASQDDLALVEEPRIVPALIGAPPALSEIAAGRRGATIVFGLALFFSAFGVLQAFALVASPDITWQRAIEVCGAPDTATRDCFDQNSQAELFGQFIVWPLGFVASIWLSRWLLVRARRRTLRSAAEAMAADDTTAPILFLRAFQNDQVQLDAQASTPIRWLIGRTRSGHSLDHILVEEFAAYGPTVALGRPNEETPPFGVWRTYLRDASDAAWQGEVARLAELARAIVMVADDGKGVAWELEHIGQAGHCHKTIFLAPPQQADAEVNARLWSSVGEATGLSRELRQVSESRPVLAMFLDQSGNLRLATSERFAASDYLVALRWFFEDRRLSPSHPTVALPG